jgi:hypothetical protein
MPAAARLNIAMDAPKVDAAIVILAAPESEGRLARP